MKKQTKAVVIFSGGQDSTTCLYWAKARYDHIEAITFNYGQKHSVELQQAKAICEKEGVNHIVIDISLDCVYIGLDTKQMTYICIGFEVK